MTRTQKLIGGSLLSLLLVGISLFSRCGIQMQRVASEDDFVAAETPTSDDEIAWQDDGTAFTDADTVAVESDADLQALLTELQSSNGMSIDDAAPVPEEETAQADSLLPADAMNRLRKIVGSEMQEINQAKPQRVEATQPPQVAASEPQPEMSTGDLSQPAVSAETVPEPQEQSRFLTSLQSLTGEKPQAVQPEAAEPVIPAPPAAEPEKPAVPVTTAVAENDFPAEMLYQDALDAFYARRYQQAIHRFRKLLVRGDAGELADNCQYWIGECYFAMGDYYQAIVEFEKIYMYENANKLADAQLMVGVALFKIGQMQEAKTELSMVMSLSRNRAVRAKARRYLNMMKRV